MYNLTEQFAGAFSDNPAAEFASVVTGLVVFVGFILLTLMAKTTKGKILIVIGGFVLAIISTIVVLGVMIWRST